MSDFVLRGYCKKCELPLFWNNEIDFNNAKHSISNYKGTHQVEPVWFLSAKQMRIILESIVYINWIPTNYNRKLTEAIAVDKLLSYFLEDEPFLVAKILKQKGEKEHGKSKKLD